MPPPKTPYDLTRRTPGRRGSAAFQTDRKVTEFYDLSQGTLGKGGFGEVKIAVRKGDGKKYVRCRRRDITGLHPTPAASAADDLAAPSVGGCTPTLTSHAPSEFFRIFTPNAPPCVVAFCRFAAKIISKLKFASEDDHDAMMTEVDLMMRARGHPNVVELVEFCKCLCTAALYGLTVTL